MDDEQERGSRPGDVRPDDARPTDAFSAGATPGTVGGPGHRAVPGGSSRESVRDPGTGDASVDEALRALEGLDTAPLGAHVAAFDAVHGALQDRLAEAQG